MSQIEHLDPKQQPRGLINELNDLTAICFGKPVPLDETVERFGKADHLFLVRVGSRLVGYALNDHLRLVVDGVVVDVNYWGSAFFLPEYQGQGLYNEVNDRRVNAIDAQAIMTRTQCPPVASSFKRTCDQIGFQATPSEDGSIDGRAVLIAQAHFKGLPDDLLCKGVYGRELMAQTPAPEGYARVALAGVDPKQGDARVLVGIKDRAQKTAILFK